MLFPFTSVLVTRYMDSSFLMDLNAMSSLISSCAAISDMDVSVPTASYTSWSVSVNWRTLRVAAA